MPQISEKFSFKKEIKIMFLGENEKFIKILKSFSNNVSFISEIQKAYIFYKKYQYDILITETNEDIFLISSFLENIKKLERESKIILILDRKNECREILKNITVEINGIILEEEEKSFLKFFKEVLKDVIKRKLKIKKEFLAQKIVNSQDDLIAIVEQNSVKFANKAFLDFFDVKSLEDFNKLNKNLCDYFIPDKNYFSCHQNSQEDMIDEFLKLPEEKRIVSMICLKYFEPRAFILKINRISQKQAVFIFTDITRISLKSREFEKKASYDELTNIHNRIKFNEILEYEMEKAKRYGNSLSLIITDIDNFKQINDNYGHLFGDKILKETAQVLKKAIRSTDIIARWGGEEFVILLNNCTLKNAQKVAENLRKKVEESFKETPPHITCSFGVSELKEYDTKESFLNEADKALYKAKRNGKNRVEISI